jgi:chorismate lyase/3-hydroxybenzoate synthase
MIIQLPNDRLDAPAWLDELCPPPDSIDTTDRYALSRSASGGISRLSGTLLRIDRMDAKELESAVAAFYARLFTVLEENNHPFLLRIWNGLPGIVERMSAPPAELRDWESRAPQHEPFDRYMAFNAGRSSAFHERLGGDTQLASATPAATAVGHQGRDLQIHILASDQPGTPIENPRQTPAYRYSPRYGPCPPVFARATRFGDKLFVSGTASVVGEQSMHADKLQAQLRETLNNLQTVTELSSEADITLRHFRAYAPNIKDLPRITETLRSHYPDLQSLELMQADICRRDLSVEIEAAT